MALGCSRRWEWEEEEVGVGRSKRWEWGQEEYFHKEEVYHSELQSSAEVFPNGCHCN